MFLIRSSILIPQTFLSRIISLHYYAVFLIFRLGAHPIIETATIGSLVTSFYINGYNKLDRK